MKTTQMIKNSSILNTLYGVYRFSKLLLKFHSCLPVPRFGSPKTVFYTGKTYFVVKICKMLPVLSPNETYFTS